MPEEESPLTDLAVRIGKLLRRPERMAVIRRMAESCLADHHARQLVGQQMHQSQFERPIEPYAELTPKQTALVVVILHDVCRHNIEKVIDIDKVVEGVRAITTSPPVVDGCRRRWWELLEMMASLPESSAPWFTLQLNRFESIIKAEETRNVPTIWFHGVRQYSIDGKNPLKVSEDHDSILQAFLESQFAMETADIENKAGVTNASRAMKELAEWNNGIFRQAIRIPKGKGKGGYFARVQLL